MASGTVGCDRAGRRHQLRHPARDRLPPAAGARDAPTRTGCSRTRPRTGPVLSPLATSKSYPARKGFDEYYGYGRVNMVKAIEATDAGTIPPEAEITSPEWYEHVDPTQPTVTVRGDVYARGSAYTCRVEVAPGSEPNNGSTTDIPAGRLQAGLVRPGATAPRTPATFSGALATLDLNDLEVPLPRDRRAPSTAPSPRPGRRTSTAGPTPSPTGSSCAWSSTTTQSGSTLTGQDRRNMYLHRDQDMLPGLPEAAAERRRVLAAARRPRRRQPQRAGVRHLGRHRARACAATAPSCPAGPSARDPLPLHTGGDAFTSGEVDAGASHVGDPRLARGDRPRPRRPARGGRGRHGRQGLRLERRRLAALQARGRDRLLRQAARSRSRTCAGATATARSTASSARPCSPTSTATAATSR